MKVKQLRVAKNVDSRDAWKNPKERELKGKPTEACQGLTRLVLDAWKNPKERELKVSNLNEYGFW